MREPGAVGPKRKFVWISVPISREVRTALDAASQEAGVSRSEFVRRAIREMLVSYGSELSWTGPLGRPSRRRPHGAE